MAKRSIILPGLIHHQAVNFIYVFKQITLIFIQEIAAVVESPSDLRRYPFAEQKLKAIFEPSAYYGTQVKLVTRPEMIDLPELPVHAAGWEMHSLRAESHIEQDGSSNAQVTQLIVILDMRREPGFIIGFIN